MKHIEVRQKYSAARRIFNSFLISVFHETLRLMHDILLLTPTYHFTQRRELNQKRNINNIRWL